MARSLNTPFHQTLAQAKRGQEEAITCLYYHFYQMIFTYISHRVPPIEIEDITQDVFFRMVRDIQKAHANNEAAFSDWLYAIAYAACMDYYRKEARLTTVRIEEVSEFVSPDDPTRPIELAERMIALRSMIEQLTTKTHRIVVGRSNGQAYRAIAKQHDIKEAVARKKHSRATQKIKSEMIAHLLASIVVCILLIAALLHFAGRAVPGEPLYPIRQLVSPSTPTPMPTPTPIFIPVPILPTPSPSPSPTPTPAPARKATSVPASSGNMLSPVATALSNSAQVACVLGTCLP